MNDSLRWLGEHCYEPPGKVPGMRGGVSLTAVRGLPVAELLGRLRAREEEMAAPVRYRDFDFSAVTPSLRPCMYGTSGEWSYVLEGSGSSTWYERWFYDDSVVKPLPGEDLVCLNPNIAVQPCWLAYTPGGDGAVWFTEFGESPLSSRKVDTTGKVAALDEALRAAGAVNPGPPEFGSTPEWVSFLDEHHGGLPAVVWQAVGDGLGIRIPRTDVEEGNLPIALLDDPFA
ncbi:hypothetical protein [Streptomyces sp. NRRL S-646]|uniref:hypothetical protein n=1 Tax=Streptomyces sp. NRRL S-646 TaxID=1463917 RepID=UPI0004CB9B41|nr:hypothetical protein [Streptomyces sp. NRRL S-646]